MSDPRFYERAGPFTLGELAAVAQAELGPQANPDTQVHDVGALEEASSGVIVYARSGKDAMRLAGLKACCLIVKPSDASAELTDDLLLARQPQAAFVRLVSHFYPPAAQHQFPPMSEQVDPSARLGEGAVIGRGAYIGHGAEIGADTHIGPNSVIGQGVCIGRNCMIGPNVTIACALVGDGVLIHPGSAIGQDGFGFLPIPSAAYLKIPQIGRVIIQDNVEIGSCAAIDRGALGDTLVGEGTKIGDQVHIAHNCRIGRHVIIAAQVGISGSCVVGDYAVFGGQVGVADHVTIGDHARIAARGGVMSDLPAGGTYGGFPAQPRISWLRQVAWLNRRVKENRFRDRGPPEPTGEDT